MDSLKPTELVTVIEEPASTVAVKLSELTVIESMVADEPLTLIVSPLTERTVSVVSVTSLAASASAGRRSESAEQSVRNCFTVVYLQLALDTTNAPPCIVTY